MEAGGGWQSGPCGAGQGQAGRHLAGGHGPYVSDVLPLVIWHRSLVMLSSIIGHRLVLIVFWSKQEVEDCDRWWWVSGILSEWWK